MRRPPLLPLAVPALLALLALPARAEEPPQRPRQPATPPPAAAEAPAEAPAGRLAMDELGHLAGEWKGEGWIRMGPGEPSRFTSRETVEPLLGGRVLLVQGLHHDAETGEVVHDAMAVISPAEDGGYRFHTWLANGRGGEYPAHLEGDDLVWEMETPRGPIRYTIEVDDHRWHEVGDIRMDGEWRRFFEMTLQRVATPRPRR